MLLNQRGGGYDRSGWRMGDRMGSGERIQMQQGAGKGGQDYTQRQTDAHVSAGREVNTHGGFSDGRRGMGGGLGLGSGPLGLPLPTPQMAIKKLLKKVSRLNPLSGDKEEDANSAN